MRKIDEDFTETAIRLGRSKPPVPDGSESRRPQPLGLFSRLQLPFSVVCLMYNTEES